MDDESTESVKITREALRVSESRYRRLFETARDGILLLNAESAQIEDVNPFLIELLGYSHAEFLGKKLWEVGAFADIAQSKEMFQIIQTEGFVRYANLPLKTVYGRTVAVEFVSNSYDCEGVKVIQCNVRDITANQKADRLLHEFKAIIDASDDAIISKSLDGTIKSWNPAATKLFGYAADEAIDRHISIIIPPDHLSEEAEILARLACGKRVDHFETVRRHMDGYLLDISVTISPIVDSNHLVVGASTIARDISELKLNQERLAALNHQLREFDRRKDEFLATLAHELRNPLAALAAAAHLLSRSSQKPSTAALAQDALTRQVELMARLLDDLLEISRINNGRVHLQKSRYRLRDSINAALEMTQPLLEQNRRMLNFNVQDEGVIVDADKVRLTQVFANLLTNAIKYTDANGQIDITMRRVEQFAEISVRDNGIGIAPESLEYVFEMFSQSQPALQRSQGGLGIGLSLVRGLVRLHDGEVFARSNGLGKGSTFIVRLPIVTDDIALTNQPKDRVDTPIAAAPLRILIADDNVDAASSWATMLEMEGHDVRVVHNGTEAVALAAEFVPDVALLDIGMPGMNGYEVASALRTLDAKRIMAIVAITGFGSEHDKRRALGSGFDHHFTKPINPDDLLRLLQRVDRTNPTPAAH